MGKKRAREADGQTEPAGASADKMDEDSSDDEVTPTTCAPHHKSHSPHLQARLTNTQTTAPV